MSDRIKVRGRAVSAIIVILVLASLLGAAGSVAAPPEDAGSEQDSLSVQIQEGPSGVHEPMSPAERLARPPMSDPPTQIELGHAEYWMSCMVCHGDRGQGLTEEWRSVLDPADMNCWQSKCHAPNHPPEGFQIPRTSPMVMGTGALSGYETAAELFEYIRVTMPWSFPGLFDDKKYWELTAFLADANHIDLPPEPLGPDNAQEVLMVPDLVQVHRVPLDTERIAVGILSGLLVCAAGLFWWIRK